MAKLATVKVKHPNNDDDFILINEKDFDADVHEKWDGPEEEPVEETPEFEHNYAGNGRWKIVKDGEIVESGAGRDSYEAALEEYGLEADDE